MNYRSLNYRSKWYNRTSTWVIAGIILVVGLFVGSIVVEHALQKTVTFTVQDKAAVATHDGHKYMVYTDNGVYQDTDSFAFLKFDSSDVYGQLMVGHTYTCDVTGVRIPIFSVQRNIISCKEVR